MYRAADKELAKIQAYLKREALKLDNTGFDQFHTLTVQTITTRLMKRLKKKNEDSFWIVALIAYEDAVSEARKRGFTGRAGGLASSWLDNLLKKPNAVTGYLYNPEADRKRLRLSEAISTALFYKDHGLKRKEVQRFFNLWFRQTTQYMIDTVDSAETQAWLDLGVEYAQWKTAGDEKVCPECRDLNNKIFPVDDFPAKPHYNCRCRKVPMPKGWKPI